VRGETLQGTARVRQDPNVHTTPGEMDAWLQQARTIERMACTARLGAAQVRALDGRLEEIERLDSHPEVRESARRVREALRPVFLAFVGDVRDPGHVNLPGRINWLTIQVGNYSGRPTQAQMDWIARYDRMVRENRERLDQIRASSLAELNRRLREAGIDEVGPEA